MSTITWLIVSILILTITVWVHKHTYVKGEHNYYKPATFERVPFPMWLLLLLIVVSFIPIVNIFLFISGGAAYLCGYINDDLRLGNLPKWLKSVLNFLIKEV